MSLAIRFALAALIFGIWAMLRKERLHYGIKQHGQFVVLGAFLFCLNYQATYGAQHYIASALNAIVFSTMVWLNIINARLFFGVRTNGSVWAAAILGITGVILLFGPRIENLSFKDATVLGALMCFGGALTASLGNMMSQQIQSQKLPVIATTFWGMLYGATGNFLVAAWTDSLVWPAASLSYWVSMAHLVVFGSVVAFASYLVLLGRIGAHRAGYAVVMFPVVAIIISIIWEGLNITWPLVLASVLILTGNVLIMRTKKPSTTSSRAGAERLPQHPESDQDEPRACHNAELPLANPLSK